MTAVSAARMAKTAMSKDAAGQPRKDGPAFDMEAFKLILDDRYRAWAERPIEERIRDKYLSDHKLTGSSLASLPPEERLLHEERIAKQTKQPMLKSYGAEDLDKAKNSMSLLSERTLLDVLTLKVREAEFAATQAQSASKQPSDPE